MAPEAGTGRSQAGGRQALRLTGIWHWPGRSMGSDRHLGHRSVEQFLRGGAGSGLTFTGGSLSVDDQDFSADHVEFREDESVERPDGYHVDHIVAYVKIHSISRGQ